MKIILRLFLPVLTLFILSSCAVTHKYGPYMGKVVDKNNGEPIEGAVVFIRFYTEFGLTPGGPVGQFVDAMEALTDEKGEYYLAPLNVITYRVGSNWDKRAYSIIFKPGYGAYPDHPESSDGRSPKNWLREGEAELIKLPKLKTRQERLSNLRSFGGYGMTRIPCEKQRQILKLFNSERISLGLEPVLKNKCGDILNEK